HAASGLVAGIDVEVVNASQFVRIVVVPRTLTLQAGNGYALSVVGVKGDGTSRDATEGAGFHSDDSSVVSTSGNLLTAVKAGDTTIHGSAYGLSDAIPVHVT